MIFTYTFNYCYIKRKHSQTILKTEGGNLNRSLYSLKKIMLGLLMGSIISAADIIYRNYFEGSTLFPSSTFVSCLILTLIIWNFSRTTKIRDYFWHKVHQKTVNYHQFRINRRTRIQPQLKAVVDIELQQI